MKFREIKHHEGGLYGYEFHCPGCTAYASKHGIPDWADVGTHVIPTTGDKAWQFNDDTDKPTLSPSILNYEKKRSDGFVYYPRCHSFVRDGHIQYLADCGHELAGQTVEIPEWEEPQ